MAPGGHRTRPTADRTRQALFNVLAHAPWARPLAGARVIDLFAGSGALGLEALSRGAAEALFIDEAPEAIQAIGENLRHLRIAETARTLRADATRLTANPGAPFDLVFLDPPYAKGLCEPALAGLPEGGWLAPGALAVVERGSGEAALAAPGFEVLDVRVWGAARVSFLKL